MKILLIEDDSETAEYIVSALVPQGHDIDQTGDAVKVYCSHAPAATR
jgi:DNA-binding response OmpR family regulator